MALSALGASGCSAGAPRSRATTSQAPTTTALPTSSTTIAPSSTTSVPASVTTTTKAAKAGPPPTTTAASPQTVSIGAADDGKTVHLRVSDTLVITLTGCGGCGYQWVMTGQPNPVVFANQGHTSTTSTTSTSSGTPPMVGTPVTYTWTFKALSAHTTAFQAGYFPPGSQRPDQTYRVTLVVSP